MKNLTMKIVSYAVLFGPMVYALLTAACAVLSGVHCNAEATAAWLVATMWAVVAWIEQWRADFAEDKANRAIDAICDLAEWIKNNPKVFGIERLIKQEQERGEQ